MRKQYVFSSKQTGKFRKRPETHEHKVEFPKLVKQVIDMSDIIIEVLDSRYIEKTRNKELESIISEENKRIIYVLNKADLVDVKALKLNKDVTNLKPYVLFSIKSKLGRARLRELIKIEAKKLKVKDRRIKVGIIGYPNTGKSSIINLLTMKGSASTSSQPGHTKVIQKLRLTKDIVILDTPGVFQENENPETNTSDLKKHATIGIKPHDKVKDPEFIVSDLMKQNPGLFERYYKIKANNDAEILIEKLGEKLNFKKKGNLIDTERTARLILKDWQQGRIKKSFNS